jgi:hypothetical protein
MKKIIGLIIANAAVSLTLCSQKIDAAKVPAPVKESFTRQFRGALPKWEKEDGKYEAGFKQNGHEISALFEANGTMTESEMEIAVSELPVMLKEYIKTHYNNAAIKEAAKITSVTGKIEYEAAIKGKDIIFDVNGNFIKEIVH